VKGRVGDTVVGTVVVAETVVDVVATVVVVVVVTAAASALVKVQVTVSNSTLYVAVTSAPELSSSSHPIEGSDQPDGRSSVAV
jgi:hypothetical protein